METYNFNCGRWFKFRGSPCATLFTLTCGALFSFFTLTYFMEHSNSSFINVCNCSHEDNGSLKGNLLAL